LFESMQAASADAILGLIIEHKNDPRPEKVDLGVGVFRTAEGETPVLDAVKKAEQRLVDTQEIKAYIGTAGDPNFNAAMQELTFADSVDAERVSTIQAPGGSGSLRVAASLILRARPDATVWLSDPTWANHIPLLGGAGVQLKSYPYYDTEKHVIRIDRMLDALSQLPAGDLVLLHGCCHNPSGLDPSEDEWRAIADVMVERGLVPFVDMAYQGFSSSDRVGILSVLAADKASRDIVHSQINNVVRTIYSVPPDHGAVVVSTILNDPELKAAWRVELAEMRGRLREMRVLLNDALREKAPDHDFSHLVRAKGMFCFLGINEDQVNRLKKDYGVYMVGSSRINTAGITVQNVNYLADAIAATL